MSAAYKPAIGDKVRARCSLDHFYSEGDEGVVHSHEAAGFWWVDFSQGPDGQSFHQDGIWAVAIEDMEAAS